MTTGTVVLGGVVVIGVLGAFAYLATRQSALSQPVPAQYLLPPPAPPSLGQTAANIGKGALMLGLRSFTGILGDHNSGPVMSGILKTTTFKPK